MSRQQDDSLKYGSLYLEADYSPSQLKAHGLHLLSAPRIVEGTEDRGLTCSETRDQDKSIGAAQIRVWAHGHSSQAPLPL